MTQTAEQIARAGGEALSFTTDVTDAFAVERTFTENTAAAGGNASLLASGE